MFRPRGVGGGGRILRDVWRCSRRNRVGPSRELQVRVAAELMAGGQMYSPQSMTIIFRNLKINTEMEMQDLPERHLFHAAYIEAIIMADEAHSHGNSALLFIFCWVLFHGSKEPMEKQELRTGGSVEQEQDGGVKDKSCSQCLKFQRKWLRCNSRPPRPQLRCESRLTIRLDCSHQSPDTQTHTHTDTHCGLPEEHKQLLLNNFSN